MKGNSHPRRGGRLMLVLALPVLLLLLVFASASGAEPAASGVDAAPAAQPDSSGLQRLVEATGGRAVFSQNSATGKVGFLRITGEEGLSLAAGESVEAESAAFFQQYGSIFGISDAAAELTSLGATTDAVGMQHLSYRQVYQGVPVFAAILRVHYNAAGALSAANGVFVPSINVNVAPSRSATSAASTAIAATALSHSIDGSTVLASDLSAAATKLYVYRDGLIQGVPGSDYLVYEVEVRGGAAVRDFVYVDAHTGKVVNHIAAASDALYRKLYEQNTGNLVWQEGNAFPGALNVDQQNIVNFSGHSYAFFSNAFGRDSYDAAGAQMRSVNNDPTISCPNANWNGVTTNYCNGVTSDDVVAHEWGHAYTEYTHGLIYQWQSGALNESYSDIWGETVDMINGMQTDTPAPVRTVNSCSTFETTPPVLVINSPAAIAGTYVAGSASFGPALTVAGLTGNVVVGVDPADGAGPTTTDACSPLTNAAAVAGKVALVDRGTCSFTIKVKNAQNAGATGVIVADNVAQPVAGMSGTDATITIPSLRVTLATGNLIKGQLPTPGVNASLKLAGGNPAEASYRWLMGEDSTAFGGNIRDMWDPTCKGDPGKVSDTEYWCATGDGGGVHTNSGVPNHGYALLVDGGTYNGQAITSIGMVKAAHIYWRAMTTYQTPTSGFADHADALETACTDLIGQNLTGLSTGAPAGPSGQSINASDCAEVADMIDAVQLRTDPTQCNFQPLLDPNAPALCAIDAPSEIYSEDFESGLGGWTLTNQGVYAGWPNFNWAADASLPGGRAGTGAYGTAPDAGNCDAGPGDISGAMQMASSTINIPAGANTPRLAFDHYVATEAGYDGGNLKISVNGGAFTLVPAVAFTFNDYNTTLVTAAGGNTNPLAGQAGFSGTDGGELGGSWGQSQVNLGAAGVVPGDSVKLRYDMGMDGCGGIDGWYVDDVTVYSCENVTPVCTGAVASTTRLWPANHKFKSINVVGVTDPDGDPLSITINSIFQDEAVDAHHSGNTAPDGTGLGTNTAKVRAERVSKGNGRVYYISYTAEDTDGATCSGTVTVGVPKNVNGTPVGEGPLYNSTVTP
ncbi:Thermolysin metallopeptidase [Candidatus Promineifilum breve]|uniref:Thermolysin metallopeptidase n=1 Tax=Candidatus Promineifilum breve TaxID=1806508 RepID=A0A170PG23_9CHLR|nr:M4 family metallopeptidase [Candidatus Promineifilum breve]CUS03507.2 Thermolysin metallopeptidase [Candidatus Promineifilum breve]